MLFREDDLIGRYIVQRPLGEGGFGVVYLVRHPLLPRNFALKILKPEILSRKPDINRRFTWEMNLLSKLNHPKIVQITDADIYRGEEGVELPFFVMEYLPVCLGDLIGEVSEMRQNSLSIWKKESRSLPLDKVMWIAEQLCDVLEYVHEEGIAHMDLTPGNVLFEDEESLRLKLSDFGIARVIGREFHSMSVGEAYGTPYYIAPEVRMEGEVDGRADVFSMGVLLYRMLTGMLPAGVAVPPSEVVEGIPRHVSDAVMDAMVNDVGRRLRSVEDLRRRLFPPVERRERVERSETLFEEVGPWWEERDVLRIGEGSFRCLAYSPDGRLIAVGTGAGIWLYDAETLNEVRFLGYDDRNIWVHSVSFSPDGELIASGSNDNTVRLWRVRDGKLIRTLRGHELPVYSVSFSPDGELIASGSNDNTVRLWRVRDGKLIRTLRGHELPVYSVSFSPDGELIASGSVDNTVRLWRVRDGKLIRTLVGHEWSVSSVSFSPDGELIASGGSGIHLWRVRDGEMIRSLEGHEGYVRSVSFSPDGELIASGSVDNTVRLWRVRDGKLIRTLEGHGSSVSSVSFSPDGELIASGSGDGTILVWSLRRILGGEA
jgi:WD40 repeat protein